MRFRTVKWKQGDKIEVRKVGLLKGQAICPVCEAVVGADNNKVSGPGCAKCDPDRAIDPILPVDCFPKHYSVIDSIYGCEVWVIFEFNECLYAAGDRRSWEERWERPWGSTDPIEIEYLDPVVSDDVLTEEFVEAFELEDGDDEFCDSSEEFDVSKIRPVDPSKPIDIRLLAFDQAALRQDLEEGRIMPMEEAAEGEIAQFIAMCDNEDAMEAGWDLGESCRDAADPVIFDLEIIDPVDEFSSFSEEEIDIEVSVQFLHEAVDAVEPDDIYKSARLPVAIFQSAERALLKMTAENFSHAA